MATGDMKNNVRKLNAELRKLKYPHEPDLEGIMTGKWEAFYTIYQYLLLNYSPLIAQEVQDKIGQQPSAVSDLRFSEALYRIFRDVFGYKPPITREQLIGSGFIERKIIMCTDVMQMVQKRHHDLAVTPTTSQRSSRGSTVTYSSKGLQRKDSKPGSATKSYQGRRMAHTSSAPQLPGVSRARASLSPQLAQIGADDVVIPAGPVTFWEFQNNVNAMLQRIAEQLAALNSRIKSLDERVTEVERNVLVLPPQTNGNA